MNYLLPGAMLAFTALVTGCGGGGGTEDNQQINQVQSKSLSYGQQAVIQVAGQYLRSSMTATAGFCKNPVFNTAQSVPELAVLNCTVTATGEQPITITGGNGQTLFKGSLTVPNPEVVLATSEGNIVLELDPTSAQVTVDNFLSYVRSGYYKNTLFHRVIAGFVAQGGGFTAGVIKKPGQSAPIALETSKGLLNTRSSLAMARTSEPNSATSEFYINLVDNANLDYRDEANPGYAVFGKVVQGMAIVDAFSKQATGPVNGFANVPVSDITINLALQIR